MVRTADIGMNFHAIRVGGGRLYIGNGPVLMGNMGMRRRGRRAKRCIARRLVLGSFRL